MQETIFRDTKINYAREAKDTSITIVNHFQNASVVEPITFTQEDAASVHYPHCDALVVKAIIARNAFLVDNGSSIYILFSSTYDKMLVDHKLIPMTSHCMSLLVTTSFQGKEFLQMSEWEQLTTSWNSYQWTSDLLTMGCQANLP